MAAKKKPLVKPTNVVELMAGLGIDPSRPKNFEQTKARATQLGAARTGRTVQARRTLGVAPTERGTAAVQQFLQSDFGGISGKPPSDDDSAWDSIKGVFGKALEIVDVPRSYVVSAAKELGDIGNNLLDDHANFIPHFSGEGQQGSWDEFTQQASDHIGYQDVVHEVSGMNQTGNWYDVDNLIGFAGDAVADPTSYIAGGGGALTRQSGDQALNAAVKSGGRKAIGKAVTDAAERAFPAERIFQSGAQGIEEVIKRNIPSQVEALMVEAVTRGRGGITRQAIKRAGLTAEQKLLLDLPEIGRGIGGKLIPGTRRVAEAVENTKGSLLKAAGSTKYSAKIREAFLGDKFGSNKLMNVIRDETASTSTRAKALQALTTVNEAAAASEGWATSKAKEVFHKDSELAAALSDSSASDWVKWIDEIETGDVTSPQAQSLSEFFTGTLAELKELGVDVAERQNYVPHMVSREAWDLAENTPEVAEIIKSVSDKVGFQQVREGSDSILKANSDFMAKHGVNLFETDPRAMIVRYMGQSTDAIGKATQQRALESMGLAELIPEYAHVAQQSKADIERLGKSRSKAALKASDNLDTLIHTREEQVQIATQALKERQRSLMGELRRVDLEVKDLARAKNMADIELERATTRLGVAQDALEANRAIVKSQRGGVGSPMQKTARAKIKELEADISKMSAQVADAKARVEHVMNNYSAKASFSLGDRAQASKGFVSETKRLIAGRTELEAQHVNAVEMLESLKLKNTPPGAGDTLADMHVRTSTDAVANLETITGVRARQAALATGVYDMAVADLPVVTSNLDQALGQVKDAHAKLLTGRAPKKNLAKKLQFAQDIEDSLAAARHVMESTDDPGVLLLARLDATAAMADTAAMMAGSEIDNFDHWLGVLKDPKFRTYWQAEVSKGFTKINETYQVEDWLAQALQMEDIVRRPEFMDDMVGMYSRFQNLWKGYAVARPGFMVRNAYSSFFNVYLEGGLSAFESVTAYQRFTRMMSKNPETYMDEAIQAFGPTKAQMLEDARKAAAATGAGQSADEVATNLLDATSKNPFNPSFAPIKAIRKGSEKIESVIRGGHAYDVLARGGSLDLAIDTITKWHFDYNDLSKFDRYAKRAMPFWTFFSRNMALQLQTFPATLTKLNRSYFNAARNLSNGEDPDTNVPDYFTDASAIRLPGVGSEGEVNYLFPDVAPTQFVSDVNNLVESKGASLLGNIGPIPKAIYQHVSNKDAFTGREFQDWNTPREVPGFYGPLGGVLETLGLAKPGGTSGDLMYTDRTQSMLENLLPTLGQTRRLTGDAEGKPDWQQILSWFGASTRTNTNKMRENMDRSEYYDRLDEIERAEKLADS